jgi:hypothetical protein
MLRPWPTALLLTVSICYGHAKNRQPLHIKQESNITQKRAVKTDEAKRAKEWLLSSIAQFFKETGGKGRNAKMFTKQYLEYKQDAIGTGYDGLTEEQFAHKWKGKYNTKLANSESLLIGQQDWVNPKVTHCQLKSKNADKSFIFNVIIEDADTQNRYIHKRDIKVIPSGNIFLIDDVLEYDN